MSAVYNNSSSFNSTSFYINNNTSKSMDKSSLTPASSMKKLLKTVRKIIFNSKKSAGSSLPPNSGLKVTSTPIKKPTVPTVILGCMTEEEHHNWLNEQLEVSFLSQQDE
ncbi:uncharacterized protein LOC105262448 [Musca domestica]|uniref:Uncharacterized protein LOC105262448 n=1 Tax=Musca domestica TaxID=7370 RepID=A0A1I8NKC3_MUSDO|nr:uncharacterized protein LOC105262448 [Musca domestica]